MPDLVRVRQTCRLCGSPRIIKSIPLAAVPIVSPNVGTERRGSGQALACTVAPLDNYLCQDCGLIQLIHVVDPSLIYRDYLYRTSISLGLADHFRGLAEAVIVRASLSGSDLVCEFGSNDGTLLSFFRARGLTVQGIDPARQIAAEATSRGIPTLPDFFSVAVARRILADLGPARAIIANNAMANIDELGEIFDAVKTLLASDGCFVFETQYALDVFENTLLDVIYHEHISTFSVQPVAGAARRYGLSVFDAERIPTKGGSVRFWLQHTGGPHEFVARVGELIALEQSTGLYDLAYHARFGEKVARIIHDVHARIDATYNAGGTVGAYGTSVGCAALIHQLKLEDRITVLFDDNPFKDRLEGPGYSLPVVSGDNLYETKPGLIIILSARYAEIIIRKHEKFLREGGAFVIPLPEVSIRCAGV
jgi:hypothetical protein